VIGLFGSGSATSRRLRWETGRTGSARGTGGCSRPPFEAGSGGTTVGV
jgi:hypothetical protein